MRKAFKMKLYENMKDEYIKRHQELWGEMKKAIHDHGGKNYSIFLDEEVDLLYGYIEIEDEELWQQLAKTEINKKWWGFMKDIMETNPDNSPVCIDLEEVFYLE